MDMQIRKPVPGEFYRHFKGGLYQIKMLAKDSEDGKELVVYQAMYPPFTCFVRSLAEFFSPVDFDKYPNAIQKVRFIRVNMEEWAEKDGAANVPEKRESAIQSLSEIPLSPLFANRLDHLQ